MKDPARLMGVLLLLAVLVGVSLAASSRHSSTDSRVAAKSGCNIVSTKDGPGCWCADGGWQWHCGGSECSSAQQQECSAENGSQQVVTKNEATEKSRCKLGEWACGAHCADAAVQKIFNSTWKDGKAQWLLEAGCGGNGGAGKKSDAGAVADSNDLCSNNSITSIGCQGKSVGTVVGLSGGKSCACAFTTKPDCACVVTSPAPIREHRGMQRESTSSFLKDGVSKKQGTQKPGNPAEEQISVSGNAGASVNCSADYFTHSSCRGQVPGSSCIDDGWFSAPKNGFCEKVGNGNRCECKWTTTTEEAVKTNTTAATEPAVVPTRRSDWTKDGSQQNIDKEVGSDAQLNSSTQKCSHNFWITASCRGEAVGTPCSYTKGWLTKTIHGGVCQKSGWSDCSCE